MSEPKGEPFAKDVFGNDVFLAETTQIEVNQENVKALLWMIAPFMGWKNVDHVFVSDMSSLSDFGLDDGELQQIQNKLGFTIKASDYLFEIAAKMKA